MKRTTLLVISLLAIFVFFGFQVKARLSAEHFKVIDFSLEQQQNGIAIHWTLDNETQINYFVVERSVDGKNFKTVAYILGADPSQKDCACFRYVDKITKNSKEAYYRLKYITDNGGIQYSDTKSLALK